MHSMRPKTEVLEVDDLDKYLDRLRGIVNARPTQPRWPYMSQHPFPGRSCRSFPNWAAVVLALLVSVLSQSFRFLAGPMRLNAAYHGHTFTEVCPWAFPPKAAERHLG